jgi:hypothetical protein
LTDNPDKGDNGMILITVLLVVMIVQIWIATKLIYHALLLLGEELEKITRFLIDIRNAVVETKPGDLPRP